MRDLSSFVQLSHIVPPYLRTGHMKEKYIRSKEFLSNLNLKALKIFIHCHAFFVISSICVCQLQSLEKINPKCLCESTMAKTVLSISKGGEGVCFAYELKALFWF